MNLFDWVDEQPIRHGTFCGICGLRLGRPEEQLLELRKHERADWAMMVGNPNWCPATPKDYEYREYR